MFNELPPILLNSLNQPIFKESGTLQLDAVNKIIAILDVKFPTKEDKDTATAVWIANAQDFRLTPNEIVSAYQMTINHKLKNAKSETIKVYPNLSVITQGEILHSYELFKQNDIGYQEAKENVLKLTKSTKNQMQINTDRLEFYQDEYKFYLANNEIQTPGPLFEILKVKSPMVKTDFVMKVLSSWRPKAKDDKKLKIYDSYTPAFHFQKHFVEGAIIALKLNEKTMDEWVEFWLDNIEL